jgi:hypothetical protein
VAWSGVLELPVAGAEGWLGAANLLLISFCWGAASHAGGWRCCGAAAVSEL